MYLVAADARTPLAFSLSPSAGIPAPADLQSGAQFRFQAAMDRLARTFRKLGQPCRLQLRHPERAPHPGVLRLMSLIAACALSAEAMS